MHGDDCNLQADWIKLITVTCKLIGYLVLANGCNLQADWIKLITVILQADRIKIDYL